MRISRRQFHLSLMAGLATLALPRSTSAATRPDLWLNRLTFGATAESHASFTAMGPTSWLDDQLARPATDATIRHYLTDARLQIAYPAGSDENGHTWPALDQLRPLSTLNADPADLTRLIDWSLGMDFSERTRPASEVIAAALIRAVHTPAQLREVMTQFWHDHFNVNALRDAFTAAFFPAHDAALRDHALGNFRTLLGETARQPAMLCYLNNADSRASPANENYARVLLELHTLGAAAYLNDRHSRWQDVPGAAEGLAQGCLDLDVYEVARAFTGWTVGDGRYVNDGCDAPKTGRFHYVEAWHDPYQKRVPGVEFPPNRAPLQDGEQVLDLLATHPATARFIATKLARRRLTDSPSPALTDHPARTFLAHVDAPDQIAHVIRALVLHPDFTTTPPGKLRRPFEFVAALYRATGAPITGTTNAHQWQLMRAGWRQHEYPVPTGHPDTLDKWTGASALNRLVDMALYAHDDWCGVTSLDLAATTTTGTETTTETTTATTGQFLDRWTTPLGSTGLAADMTLDPALPASAFTDAERHSAAATAAATAIAFAALTPQFLLRRRHAKPAKPDANLASSWVPKYPTGEETLVSSTKVSRGW